MRIVHSLAGHKLVVDIGYLFNLFPWLIDYLSIGNESSSNLIEYNFSISFVDEVVCIFSKISSFSDFSCFTIADSFSQHYNLSSILCQKINLHWLLIFECILCIHWPNNRYLFSLTAIFAFLVENGWSYFKCLYGYGVGQSITAEEDCIG